MDLEFINMVFGETSKKLCLVPWLVLLKFPVSHTPPRKSTYTVHGSILYSVTVRLRYFDTVGTVRYGTFTYGTVSLLYCHANSVFKDAILEE